MDTRLELGGLSDLDRDELEALLAARGVKAGDYQFAERAVDSAKRTQDFGVTALVIAIAPITVAAVSAFLAKKRDQGEFKATLRAWDENGQLRYEDTLAWKSSHSAPPPAELVQKLSEASKIDPALLRQQFAQSAG